MQAARSVWIVEVHYDEIVVLGLGSEDPEGTSI